MSADRIVALITNAIRDGAALSDQRITVPVQSPFLDPERFPLLASGREALPQLVVALRSDPALRLFDGGVLLTGSGGHALQIEMLAEWLVGRALMTSPETAVASLRAFLEGRHPPPLLVVAISGIRVSHSIELPDGFRLIPFAEVPRSIVSDALRGALRPPPMIFPIPVALPQAAAALVKELAGSPSLAKEFPSPGADTGLGDAESAANRLVTLATLVGPSPAVAIASWVHVDPSIPLGTIGQGWGVFRHEILPAAEIDISNALPEFSRVATQYLSLPQNVRDQLRQPLERLNLSLRRARPVDSAVELRIAMESLLANDLDENAPISYTLRLRAAWLSGTSPQSRVQVMSQVGEVYSLCSQATHTGAFGRTLAPRSSDILSYGQATLAALISIVITRGSIPDWRHLVLGAA